MKGPRETILARMRMFSDPAFQQAVTAALHEAGQLVEAEARHSITTGSSSGRVKGSKHEHQPSKPGEPPNNFSGDLANGIETTVVSATRARVTSHASHSAALEFGTSRMAARPFMRPARDKKRREAEQILNEKIQIIKRRYRNGRV